MVGTDVLDLCSLPDKLLGVYSCWICLPFLEVIGDKNRQQ